jgi:alginate O-acetyltransferase complex protein AlgI
MGWVLFAVTDLSQLKILFIKLFNMTGGIDWIYYIRNYGLTLIIAVLFSTPVIEIVYRKVIKNKLINTIILMLIFFISVAYLVDATYNPFLYFRF